MPTVLRIRGFEFRIYTDDHTPAHCHVHKDGTELVLTLEPITIRANLGMSASHARVAISIAETHRDRLISAWRSIHHD